MPNPGAALLRLRSDEMIIPSGSLRRETGLVIRKPEAGHQSSGVAGTASCIA